MRLNHKFKSLACPAISFLLALGASQHASAFDPANASFHRLDEDQGLAQRSVLAMVQDGQGYIWLGSQDGLTRFDGFDSRIYRKTPGLGDALSNNWVTALTVDTEGRLWVGTNAGLNRYLPERDGFENFHHDPDRPASIGGDIVFALHVDAAGTLWVGSNDGLARWQPTSGDFANYRPRPSAEAGLAGNQVRALASSSDGQIWVGTAAGLSRFDPLSGQFVVSATLDQLPTGENTVSALLHDSHDRLWVGTQGGGLALYDPDKASWTLLRHAEDDSTSLGSDIIHKLFEDRQGRIWIGTEEGVDRLDEQTGEVRFLRFQNHRHNRHSLGRGRVFSIMQDASETLWFGTWSDGASRLSAFFGRFASFGPDSPATSGLEDPSVPALKADAGKLWIGTQRGLFTFDPVEFRLTQVPHTAELYVSDLELHEGQVWIGMLEGLAVLDIGSGQLRRPTLPAAIARSRIRELKLDQGRVWLAADYAGLYVTTPELLNSESFHPVADRIRFLEVFDEQTMLAGGQEGLYWITRDGLKLLHHHPVVADAAIGGLPSSPAAFLRAADGNYWLATYGGGLLRMEIAEPGRPQSIRFKAVTGNQDLASPALDGILADDQGRLWLSSDVGISRYDPDSGRTRNFSRADGALGGGYFIGAGAQLETGQIAFGGADGFTIFDPGAIAEAPAPPAPLLNQLEIDNRPVNPSARDPGSPLHRPLHLSSELRLPAARARRISLRFTAPEYLAPAQLRFSYRLEGFDRDWIETGSDQRQASYTNLAPGEYRFRVRTSNADGQYSAEEVALTLVIDPPWWQTWWAQTVFLLATLTALYTMVRWRERRLQAQQAQLQALVAQRTSQLSEAKDRAEQTLGELRETQQDLLVAEKMASLGRLVAGVAHEINTPVGVAVTASTTMIDDTDTMKQQLGSGKLGRSDLSRYLDRIAEASRLVEVSLGRAAHLVSSFKQVSVDRSSDERRRFDLAEYLQALQESLEPSWKHRAQTLQLDCEPGLELDSYPGTVGQIITNLSQNALQHAFDETQAGTMHIQARRLDDDRIEIEFSDDGRGMVAEQLQQAFEPFYTTGRADGCTGLGLHIVFNLVTARLGGQIEATSEVDRGSRFTIRFPRVSPG